MVELLDMVKPNDWKSVVVFVVFFFFFFRVYCHDNYEFWICFKWEKTGFCVWKMFQLLETQTKVFIFFGVYDKSYNIRVSYLVLSFISWKGLKEKKKNRYYVVVFEFLVLWFCLSKSLLISLLKREKMLCVYDLICCEAFLNISFSFSRFEGNFHIWVIWCFW